MILIYTNKGSYIYFFVPEINLNTHFILYQLHYE